MGRGDCRLNGFGAYIWDGVDGWELLTCWWVCTNIYVLSVREHRA